MRISWIAAIATVALVTQPAAAQQADKTGLRIVVVKGEDAVNIIQQKTAVAPIIEVRDRNNLPVSGATVTFTIGPGGSFAGQSTLTVVTNAAGQATAAGLTPTTAGALQIQATAAFQGQTAAVTITQSNVATAAQAAGAAAGGGGGISGTTIGVIVAAVGGAGAAAAVAAKSASSGDGTSGTSTSTSTTSTSTPAPTTTPTPSNPSPPPPQQPTNVSLSGDIDYILTGPQTLRIFTGIFIGTVVNCTARYRDAGRVTLALVVQPGGQVSGTLSFAGRRTDAANNTCSAMPYPDFAVSFSGTVTGTSSSLQFTHNYQQTGLAHDLPNVPYTMSGSVSFGGSIDGGTLIHNVAIETNGPDSHASGTMTGTTTLTLR